MTPLRTRIELNKGRIGIPLSKLADISKDTERFLEKICEDLEINDPSGKWLACNFENGSLSFDIEYHGQASESQIAKCRSSLRYIAKGGLTAERLDFGISKETLLQYSKIADHMDADEVISIGVYSNGEKKPEKENWYDVPKQQFIELKDVILSSVECYGAIQGNIHTLYKDSDYISVRDISTDKLVKCYFKNNQYSHVLAALNPRDAIIHIAGMMKVSRIDRRIEQIIVDKLDLAEAYKPGDLDRFFGCAPKLTGKTSTTAFIAKVRNDGE